MKVILFVFFTLMSTAAFSQIKVVPADNPVILDSVPIVNTNDTMKVRLLVSDGKMVYTIKGYCVTKGWDFWFVSSKMKPLNKRLTVWKWEKI